MTRTFEDKPAVREQVPLLVGLMGPSGGGKTFSALRLATGIQRVSGGEIFFIDTEARRALHYAKEFNFRHVPFVAPFGPLDYLAAIQHCVKQNAGVVIIDSCSHEHEGPGGVLEMHDAEVKRRAGNDFKKAEKVKMVAWAKPKAERRRLINSLLQMNTNFIFCFRAKEKLRIVKGKDPEPRGFMPITDHEWVYEMTTCCLLPPSSQGTPQWRTEYPDGEGLMMKLPGQFQNIMMPRGNVAQLDESIGEQMAQWAAGGDAPSADDVIRSIENAETIDQLAAIAAANRRKPWSKEDTESIRAAIANRKEWLSRAGVEETETADEPDDAGDAWEGGDE